MATASAPRLDELAVKHLEFLQTVINRLSHESFAYKGWAVTMVVGLFAVAAASHATWAAAIALVPAFAFWGLDAYYLRQQRLYRAMYDAVRDGSAGALDGGPLSMDASPYAEQVAPYWRTLLAKSVVVPYGLMAMLAWAVVAFTAA